MISGVPDWQGRIIHLSRVLVSIQMMGDRSAARVDVVMGVGLLTQSYRPKPLRNGTIPPKRCTACARDRRCERGSGDELRKLLGRGVRR